MCGIFGAIGREMDYRTLWEIIERAGRRGPHASGIAWLKNGGILARKLPGAVVPDDLLAGITTPALIGNCRLSTSGTPRNENNNQPIVLPGVAVSHNGNIPGHLRLAEELGIKLETDCDSEIIGHLLNRYGMEKALERLQHARPMALLVLQKNKITAFRFGQPLYHAVINGGHYFCSRFFNWSNLLPEGKAIEFCTEVENENHQNVVIRA